MCIARNCIKIHISRELLPRVARDGRKGGRNEKTKVIGFIGNARSRYLPPCIVEVVNGTVNDIISFRGCRTIAVTHASQAYFLLSKFMTRPEGKIQGHRSTGSATTISARGDAARAVPCCAAPRRAAARNVVNYAVVTSTTLMPLR